MSEIIIEMPPDFSASGAAFVFFGEILRRFFFCGVQRSQEQRNTKNNANELGFFFGAGVDWPESFYE